MEGHIYKVVVNDARSEMYVAVVLKEGEKREFTLLRRHKEEHLVEDMALLPIRRVSAEEFDAEVRRRERE